MGILNMKKEKMFILHGWTYSTEKWTPFVNELKKSDINVVVLKIPGLTAPLAEVWGIEDYVNWLSEILKKEDQVILLGHSNGGLISLTYALKYPNKVKQLILIDSTGIYHNELSIRLKRFIFASAAKVGKKLTSSVAMRKFLYKLARAYDYENAPDQIIQKTMVNLIRTDLKDKFSRIQIPTIIIWGKNDQVTPSSDGEVMRREIKNSSLYIISGAWHSPQITHPKDTAKIILENI
jgi:pimeloyl-ACP methyl ester carboxylesterase